MSYHRPIDRVQDYTDAFLASLGVLLFMALCAIAALAGYLWVAITAYLIDRSISWLGAKRAGR